MSSAKRTGGRLPGHGRGAPESAGVHFKDNWDALGMRASGSQDVVFSDCFVPDAAMTDVGPRGVWTPRFLIGNMVITLGLLGAFLGIAEAAHGLRASRP